MIYGIKNMTRSKGTWHCTDHHWLYQDLALPYVHDVAKSVWSDRNDEPTGLM